MIVSIEVPIIRGGWLIPCIDSVLTQTSPNWTLSLLWGGGDDLSRDIVERLAAIGSPRIRVHTSQRIGIARSRQFLSECSGGDLILPLDDDDVLEPHAVECFITWALAMPWAGIIRARRSFIDEKGAPVRMTDWFPFERRHYFRGATLDVANHSQPYAIRRDAFLAAGGWTGFDDFLGMGEDCGCFATMEAVSDIGLVDIALYRYRLHGSRTSHRVTDANATEMWRRIADRAVIQRSAPVTRVTQLPPFTYSPIQRMPPSIQDLEVVIPFWETDQRELPYGNSRPGMMTESGAILLLPHAHCRQEFDPPLPHFSRLSVALSSTGAVDGHIVLAFFDKRSAFSPTLVVKHRLTTSSALRFEFINVDVPHAAATLASVARVEIGFQPSLGHTHQVLMHTRTNGRSATALMRFFEDAPGHCRRGLDRCLASLAAVGIGRARIHVVEERASAAANRNTGIAASTADWILFMDDDAELVGTSTLPALFDGMLRLDGHVAGPKLLDSRGRIYSGLPEIDPLLLETRVGGMGENDAGQHDVDQVAPWLPSTVLLAHRSVLLAAGGFDERFEGSQHEDADFTLRARDRGFDCCYVGSATAIHHNELRNSHFSRNNAYLAERWKGRLDLFSCPIARAERSTRTRG